MPEKKKNDEKEYRYISITVCTECGTKQEKPQPCQKCGNKVFVRHLELEIIK